MKLIPSLKHTAALSAAMVAGVAPALCQNPAAAKSGAPNIVVILVDDLGFSDLGCYGSEIRTPVLDGLAKDGIRLTQIYNSSRSCPTRASLLTGLHPHQTGMGHMDGKPPRWPKGYRGFRSNSDNVTIAEVLKDAGYYTAMSGKLHLGRQTNPIDRGFEDYYGLLGGFNSFWDSSVYTRLPEDRPVIEYPEGTFYATNAITDYAIQFAYKAKEVRKPLFLYLAYNAPHFPLHAPKEATDRYMETYLQGWDKIRDQRFERMVKMGLLQGKPKMSPRGVVTESVYISKEHPVPAWDSLTKDQQYDLARRMAIFAAMVDIMDADIGRFLEALRRNGQLDNTFIVFMSDNGACAEWHEFGFDFRTGIEYHTHTGAELDGMGLPGTYHHYGTGWANAGNTPLSLYKHFAHEGGICSPSIAWWGNNIKRKGSIDHQPMHLVDVMATCVDLAGVEYPKKYQGRDILPMEGVSILPVLKGKTLPERSIFVEHEGNRMVRRGDWKIVSAQYTCDRWELYNIRNDRTEQNNLASKYPEKVRQLAREYDQWAKRCDVLPFAKMWNEYSLPNQPKLKECD